MIGVIALLSVIACAQADIPTLWVSGGAETQRIIKGLDANEGEFPFMVSLRYWSSTPGHSCGGSILTPNWILTAAHCCPSKNAVKNYYIYAGSIYLSKGGTKHQVVDAIIHENYQTMWKNDICLIKVSNPIQMSEKVKQVRLPPQGWPVEGGDDVYTCGWGLISPTETIIPDRLQKSRDFYAMSMRDCAHRTDMEMFEGYLCARSMDVQHCTWNGDSGSPLLKNGTQVGLTSFGFRPYGQGLPTVYTRVPMYINWIKKQLGPDAAQLVELK